MMTFGAPLWLAAGALGAVGVFLLHLLRRTDREPRPLPTARFIPEHEATQVVRWSRLSDRALLAVRAATILALALAMADPRWTWRRNAVARLVLVDQSRAMTADGARAVLARWGDGAAALRVVAFDSAARVVANDAVLEPVAAAGSLSAALIVATREARQLQAAFDSVEVVLVSPVLKEEFDAATRSIREQIALPIRVVRSAPGAPAPAPLATIATTLTLADPLGAAVRSSFPVRDAAPVRMVRAPATTGDSVWARESGHVLVVWPSAGRDTAAGVWAAVASAKGAAIGPLERGAVAPPPGRAIIRWADGSPAATETATGAGCVRTVAFAPAGDGDFALSVAFRRQLLALVSRCGGAVHGSPAPDSVLRWLANPSDPAGPVLLPAEPSRWPRVVLLALTLLLAMSELGLRGRRLPVTVSP